MDDDVFRFLGDLAKHPEAHLEEARRVAKIRIDKRVTTIGEGAFRETDLQEVHFEKGSQLETIGKESFAMTKIEAITIPSSVKEIGEGAFRGQLPVTFEYDETIDPDMITAQLKKVEFEKGSRLRKIGKYAFCFTKLSTISIHSSVIEIEDGAFFAAPLEELTLKQGIQLEIIAKSVFQFTKLSSVVIPASVKQIQEKAFCGSAVHKVEFEQGCQLVKIGEQAFEHTNISTISICSSVKEIGAGAFIYSELLQEIEFEEGSQLQMIAKYAFHESVALSSIMIPASVTTIGQGAFYFSALKKVEFESGSQLVKIESGVFECCSDLEVVVFDREKSSLQEIHAEAFNRCIRLIIFHFPFSLKKIQGRAFQACRLKIPLIVTKSMLEAFDGLTEEQQRIPQNEVVSSCDTHVIVNDDVDRIPPRSMMHARKLRYVDLPPTLLTIDEMAFDCCYALELIRIPDSTSRIGKGAFSFGTTGTEKQLFLLYSLQNHLQEKVEFEMNDVSNYRSPPIWARTMEDYHYMYHLAFWGCCPPDENYDSLLTCMKSEYERNPCMAIHNPEDPLRGMSALHLYLKCGHSDVDVIKWMAESYPEGLKSCKYNRSGETALHIYLSRGHSDIEMIKWMINKYPDALTIRDVCDRNYPIHQFCASRKSGYCLESHAEVVRLLAKGIPLMVPDRGGFLPFAHALENLSWSAVETLYSFEPVTPFGENTVFISRLKKKYIQTIENMESEPRSLDTMEQNGWVKFAANHIYSGSSEAKNIVGLIEKCKNKETVKILAFAKTLENVSALEIAIPEIRQALQKRLLFLGRYEINTSYVIHKSHTCVVLEARDVKMDKHYGEYFDNRFGTDNVNELKFRSFLSDYGFFAGEIVGDQDKDEAKKYFDKIDADGSGTISKLEFLSFCKDHLGDKVVLKLMKNANQFQNEIESRRRLEAHLESVVGILRSHSPYCVDENTDYEKRNHAGDSNNGNSESEALYDVNEITSEGRKVVKKEDEGMQESEVTDTSKNIDDFLETIAYNSPNVKDDDLKEHVQDIFNRLNKKSDTLEEESATSYKYIIVMVKGGKNLDSIFRSEQPGSNAIRGLAKEVGRALLSLHGQGIIHGDIKMLNIVRDETANRLKLIDLDASVDTDTSDFITSKFSSGVLPPEAIRLIKNSEARDKRLRRLFDKAEKEGSKKVALWDDLDKEAFFVKNVYYKDEICTILKEERMKAERSLDVWAFGVLLYALCTGESLFAVNRDDDIVSFEAMKQLYNWDIYKKGKLHRVQDPYARRLLDKILETDPPSRLTMKRILKNDFFDPSKIVDYSVVTKQLDRMEEKIDAVAEHIQSINQNLAETNNMISELLSATTPRLVFFDPTTQKKAENWLESIKESVQLTNKIKICFACPITYKIPTDEEGNKLGYIMEVPTEWVQVWGPRIVMTLKVSQFALSVGRMAGVPIPHFLDDLQEKFESTTEKFGMAGKILNDVMNEDLMKEFVGRNELFSTGMDLVNQKTTIGEIVENKAEEVKNSIEEAAAMETPDKLQGLIKQSVEDVRKIAKHNNDDETFALTGLIRVEAKDKSVEFVHKEAATFFETHGKKIFEMSVQDMLSKYRKYVDAEKLAAVEEKRKAEIKRMNEEREAEIKRMNEEREGERKALNAKIAAIKCRGCAVM